MNNALKDTLSIQQEASNPQIFIPFDLHQKHRRGQSIVSQSITRLNNNTVLVGKQDKILSPLAPASVDLSQQNSVNLMNIINSSLPPALNVNSSQSFNVTEQERGFPSHSLIPNRKFKFS